MLEINANNDVNTNLRFHILVIRADYGIKRLNKISFECNDYCIRGVPIVRVLMHRSMGT